MRSTVTVPGLYCQKSAAREITSDSRARRMANITSTSILPASVVERVLAWTHAPVRTCEINVGRAHHGARLCERLGRTCEYVGVNFDLPMPANLTQQVRTLLKDHESQSLLLNSGMGVYSARISVASPKFAYLRHSCGLIVLRMDAASAEDRMTMITDLHAALEWVRTDAPATLVMMGHPCPPARQLETYRAAWSVRRPTQTEECWRNAFNKLAARGDVTEPLCAAADDGLIWCSGRLEVASVCNPDRPALLEEAVVTSSDVGIPKRQCRIKRDVVQYPRNLIAPEWTLGARLIHNSSNTTLDGAEDQETRPAAHGWITLLHRITRDYRYYSLLRCGEPSRGQPEWNGRLCLLFKNSVEERWVAMITSSDGGVTFGDRAFPNYDPQLALPMQTDKNSHHLPATLTHNAAFARLDGGARFAVVGGRFLSHHRPLGGGRPGIWMAVGDSLQWSKHPQQAPRYLGTRGGYRLVEAPAATQWSDFRWLFDGAHEGCTENRPRMQKRADGGSACEFDGRLSLVQHNGELLLYARANLRADGGMRYAQMTRSADGGLTWSPFALVRIQKLSPQSGELYFFAVQPNPVHNGSLVALVPIVHRGGACIGMTLSVDGLNWSPMSPLIRCAAFGERTAHHPVAGGLVRVGLHRLALFTHEFVPNIHVDKRTPAVLWQWLEQRKEAKFQKVHACMHLKRGKGKGSARLRCNRDLSTEEMMPAPSRITRIEFGCELLVRWTRQGLRALGRKPTDAYECRSGARSCA